MESALSFFLQANLALIVLLFAMVSGRKIRRDRREVDLRARRTALREALLVGGDDLDRLVRTRRSRGSFTIDLSVVLREAEDRGDTWAVAAARRMAERNDFDEVLGRRLRSRRPVTRGTSAMLLGHLRTADADVWLRPLLADPDGDVKLVTAAALARCGGGRAAAALIDALRHGTMAPERLVERLGAPWAAPTVLVHLQCGGDGGFRGWLVRALALAGHRPAEPHLIELLADTDPELRVSAARALATCGGQPAVAPLLAALGDEAWQVRAQAATALGTLGDARAVTALEACLSSPAWWVRSNAATALAALGQPGIGALRRAAAGTDTYAAERAAEELATLDRSRATVEAA